MTPSTMHTVIPVLLTLDVADTVRFYTSTLGFVCRHEQAGFAILNRSDVELHFTRCPERRLVEWSCCRVGVSGVDALYDEYSHHKGLIHPNCKLHDTDYGTREFGILDSQGVLITFFERRPNAP
jgi:catechol 2,3-dioxygenase-like lactoylglutathione lyase family enzyme